MAIKSALLHVTAAALLFFSISTCNIANAQALTTCTGSYALCATTTCVKDVNGKAICNCPIYEGKNVGLIPCDIRAKAKLAGRVYSEYSAHDIGSSKYAYPAQTCNNAAKLSYQYAGCLDMLCTISADGRSASCSCPVITSKDPAAFLITTRNFLEGEILCATVSSPDSKLVTNGAPTSVGLAFAKAALGADGRNLLPTMFCTDKGLTSSLTFDPSK